MRSGHGGDGRTVDVGVEQTHVGAGLAQRGGNVDGHRGLANAAFA